MSQNPFTTDNAALAFNHFVPLVANTTDSQLLPWPGNADIMRVNAERTLERIAPHLKTVIAARLPAVNEAHLREMPTLALAITYAEDRVIGPILPEIRKRQQIVRPLRRYAIMQLQIFAYLGLVPNERVEAIMANQGAIDEANDCIAIPEVFAEYQTAIAGKHPFTAAQLNDLSTNGNWLKAHLRVPGAHPAESAVDPDARVRDQLYTELRRRYEDAHKVAVEIWGRNKVDENIPALLARTRSAPKPKGETPEAPPAVEEKKKDG